MKKVPLFLILLLGVSCNIHNNESSQKTNAVMETKSVPDFNVALQFINDYIKFCNPELHHTGQEEDSWVQHNTLLTNHFKATYKRLLDSAQRADPELGLDFDPIFDAQDFDDSGCAVMSADTNSGYVNVMGKKWKKFTVVLKVVHQDNKWLVDGSGVINIPNNKRAPRE